MDRRKFLVGAGALVAASLVSTPLLNPTTPLKREYVNPYHDFKIYSKGFQRGDLLLFEVVSKVPFQTPYSIDMKMKTKDDSIVELNLPFIEHNDKYYAIGGTDFTHPSQTVDLTLNTAQGNWSEQVIIDPKMFDRVYFNPRNFSNVKPLSESDMKSVAREKRLLRPSWKGITLDDSITAGYVQSRAQCDKQSFGERRFWGGVEGDPHKGLDCQGGYGDEILASNAGTVVLAEKGFFYTGNTVVIDHGLGLFGLYAHMTAQDVKEGQYVEPGQRIGTVGSSGRASGAHLHWQTKLHSLNINPSSLEIFNDVFK